MSSFLGVSRYVGAVCVYPWVPRWNCCSVGALAGKVWRRARLCCCGLKDTFCKGPPFPALVPCSPGYYLLSILITRVNCRDNNAATNVSGDSASAFLNQPPSLNMNWNNESINVLKCQWDAKEIGGGGSSAIRELFQHWILTRITHWAHNWLFITQNVPARYFSMLAPPQVTQGKDLLFKSRYKPFIVRGSIIIRSDSSQAYRQPGRIRQKQSKPIAFQLAITVATLS